MERVRYFHGRPIEEMGLAELRAFVNRPPKAVSAKRIWAALGRLRQLERLERFEVRGARMAAHGRIGGTR